MPDRPLRFCDVCGGLDNHPRHVTGLPPGSTLGTPSREFLDSLQPGAPVAAVAELMNPTTVVRHMDCCAEQGCTICAETEVENGRRRGQALIDHLNTTRESADAVTGRS